MMHFLIDDISDHGALVRFADRERSVASLPAEIAVTFFPDHFCRACFELFDHLGQRDRPRKTKEQMHMVGYAAHLNWFATLAP